MGQQAEATLDDLYKVEGKAEIVNGRIVCMPPTGDMPGLAGGRIYKRLDDFALNRGVGCAYPDNVSFAVSLPHRKSVSPDAAFYTGPRGGMRFLPQSPDFAVEVRSEFDYGPAAERAIADKRADYFAAGTKVVWDVDLLSDDVIRKYTAEAPDVAAVFRRGEQADAEPAVPGWRIDVDELYG